MISAFSSVLLLLCEHLFVYFLIFSDFSKTHLSLTRFRFKLLLLFFMFSIFYIVLSAIFPFSIIFQNLLIIFNFFGS